MYKNLTELVDNISPDTLFVLDIDSSLVLTHKRNEAILRKFAQSIKDQNPPLSQALISSECLPFEYGYFAALERHAQGLDKQTTEELHQYWKHHFFSNDFLHYDIPHKGALNFVETLVLQQRPFAYLTGRPSNLMRPGTLKALADFGFHITDEMLHMKPSDTDVDESYKAEILPSIIDGYKNVIFIDNEPRVLNLIEKHHPKVNLVFVDTCHSPNVTAPDSALVIKDFVAFTDLLLKKASH
jgi:hypothetical protein